jgi:hypothetical protein
MQKLGRQVGEGHTLEIAQPTPSGLDKMFRCEDVDEDEKDVTSALSLYEEDEQYECCAL